MVTCWRVVAAHWLSVLLAYFWKSWGAFSTIYLIVFGLLSRMVKVWGACDEPFWVYNRLNNCTAPAPHSDDVLLVASLACPAHKNTSSRTTKMSSLSGAGTAQLFNRLYIQNGLSHAPRIFTIRLGTPNTMRSEVIKFGWTSPLTMFVIWSTGRLDWASKEKF